jgi:hypothetical protein
MTKLGFLWAILDNQWKEWATLSGMVQTARNSAGAGRRNA